jgi:hypothetical protein
LTMVDGVRAGSNSRRAKASSVHAAGDGTGAVGALSANGDRTALIRVDTTRDTWAAGVGVMTLDAGGSGATAGGAAVEATGAAVCAATWVAAADGVVDANDDTPAATRRVKSRLLWRTVGSAGALTASGFGLVLIDVLPDDEREVTRPLRRATLPSASSVAGMAVSPVNEVEFDGVRAVVAADADEPVVVLVCGPPDLFTAPGGFSGRRYRLAVSFGGDNARCADGASDDVEPECRDGLDGDESPDDGPLPESPGAANATAGVLATAIPTPSATTSAQMPPMCFAFSMVVPFAHPRRVNGRW